MTELLIFFVIALSGVLGFTLGQRRISSIAEARSGLGEQYSSSAAGVRPPGLDIVPQEHDDEVDFGERGRGYHFIRLTQKTLPEALQIFRANASEVPALGRLYELYGQERDFPHFGSFRLGPCPFKETDLDWLVLVSKDQSELIGHGLTTRIHWNQNADDLPGGWQDTIRLSYQQTQSGITPNSMVGLFITVEDSYRQRGVSGIVIEKMRGWTNACALDELIIPLRLPEHLTAEKAPIPYEDFALLKREDGEYADHWLRLHVRCGAKILAVSSHSHQHAMNVRDFYAYFDEAPFTETGYHVRKLEDGWYSVCADLQRQFVLIEQGCVWVKHKL